MRKLIVCLYAALAIGAGVFAATPASATMAAPLSVSTVESATPLVQKAYYYGYRRYYRPRYYGYRRYYRPRYYSYRRYYRPYYYYPRYYGYYGYY